jgi:nucleotide-binding universal stress UspA family protein
VFKNIVIANDGSEGGRKALTLACNLAKLHHSALHMISVEELPDVPASIDEVIEAKEAENHKFHAVLEQARKIAKAKGVTLASPFRRRWSPATLRHPSSNAPRP